MHAADNWDAPRFIAIFLALSFFYSQIRSTLWPIAIDAGHSAAGNCVDRVTQ
jgi:hypothetical protein